MKENFDPNKKKTGIGKKIGATALAGVLGGAIGGYEVGKKTGAEQQRNADTATMEEVVNESSRLTDKEVREAREQGISEGKNMSKYRVDEFYTGVEQYQGMPKDTEFISAKPNLLSKETSVESGKHYLNLVVESGGVAYKLKQEIQGGIKEIKNWDNKIGRGKGGPNEGQVEMDVTGMILRIVMDKEDMDIAIMPTNKGIMVQVLRGDDRDSYFIAKPEK